MPSENKPHSDEFNMAIGKFYHMVELEFDANRVRLEIEKLLSQLSKEERTKYYIATERIRNAIER